MENDTQHLHDMLSQVEGYIYPNEIERTVELCWFYPYLTGLVGRGSILASGAGIQNQRTGRTYQLAFARRPLLPHCRHRDLGITSEPLGLEMRS